VIKKYTCLILLITACTLTACTQEKETAEPLVRPVKAMVIEGPSPQSIRNFPGKVIASQRVELSFNVSGLLIELPILEGSVVEKGALIAKLDPEKYQEAVNEAEAKYVRTKAQFGRAEHLIKDKYLSDADYDAIRANYLVSEADFNTAKRNLADTQIYAPFSGVIAQKFVDNFQHVKVKEVIATLHDTSHIDIEIDLPENLMVQLKQQDTKTLSQYINAIFDAQPQKLYPVKFKEISTEADPKTQTYRFVFTMPTPKDINVLPGMTVIINSNIPKSLSKATNQYFLVPTAAVFNEKEIPYIWKINPETMTVKKVPVKAGRLMGSNIQITAGLHVKDMIVTAGAHFLQENQKVKLLK
jgi:RND family efflux transporter MFP subunit